jgi:DNA-binding NtrC family response regulator
MSTSVPIRVLILEDSASDAELMLRELRKAGLDPTWDVVDTGQGFAARLTPELDLILSDHAVPQFGSREALQLVRSRGLDVPFIIVSGQIGEDIAVEAMRNGAADYLLKDRMARLGQAALNALENRRMRSEARRWESAFRELEGKFVQIAKRIKDLF